MVSIIPITCIILFLIKMVKYASKCHQQKVPDRTSIYDSRYLWHTIVEYYVSPTYIFIVPFCFKRARFHLYIQKKNKYFLDIFKPFSPFYCFNWVNSLFYEFTFAPNNNLAQNVFFKESSNLMCTIQITKCSLQNI